MSIIKSKHYKEADVPSAASLNQPYDELEDSKERVQAVNTAPNWATKKHFVRDNAVEEPMNRLFYKSFFTSAYSVTSTTWNTLAPGGDQAFININKQAINGTILRVHWDLLTGETTYQDDADAQSNAYGFRIKVITDIRTFYSALGIYSFSGRASTTDSAAVDGDPIQWRSCAGTEVIWINPLETIQEIRLEGAVAQAGNIVDVERYNLTAIVARS